MKFNQREDKKIIESKLIDLVTGCVDESDAIDESLTPEQVKFIKDLLAELEEFDIRLIGNAAWRSIAVYFQCITCHSLKTLEAMYTSGHLRVLLERIFRCLLHVHESQPSVIKKVFIDPRSFCPGNMRISSPNPRQGE